MAEYLEFDDDDVAYLRWIEQNPTGFVVNTGRNRPTEYMLLHRATCPHISKPIHEKSPGGFTERDLIKICATEVAALREWVIENGRADGTFSKECPICKPNP